MWWRRRDWISVVWDFVAVPMCRLVSLDKFGEFSVIIPWSVHLSHYFLNPGDMKMRYFVIISQVSVAILLFSSL